MNAFVPCHSSTPKSVSNSSVMVYQGISSQPIRDFKRSMSGCGARDANTRVVLRIQMGGVSDLIGYHGAANAGMLGPAFHAGLKEGAVNDQLTAAVEQVEQARLAPGPVELVRLLYGQPRHPPTLGGQRVTGAGQLLLLHEQLLARSFPLLRRHDRGCVHYVTSCFPVLAQIQPPSTKDANRMALAAGASSVRPATGRELIGERPQLPKN